MSVIDSQHAYENCITEDFRTVLGHLAQKESLFYFINNNGLLA